MEALPERDFPTKALVVDEPGAPFVLRDIILDEVRPSEALVEIKYTGLCHTDLAVQQGKVRLGSYPAILGHEGAGVILRLGEETRKRGFQVGDRVLLSYSSCLDCTNCKAGRKGACKDIALINFAGTRGAEGSPSRLVDGTPVRGDFYGQSSFSKLAICDSRSMVKYPGPVEDLSFLAPLGCSYMTGASTVMNVLDLGSGSRIAIFGLGAVGLTALMAARNANAELIIAVDLVNWRLEFAKTLGAGHSIDAKKMSSIEEAILDISPEGVDFIVDTTGVTSMINGGVKALAQSGMLAVVGTPQPAAELSIDPFDLLIHCKKIVGVTGGWADPQELYQSGSFPIKELSQVYPVEKVDQAIADMKSGKVIKPIIAW